VDEGSGTADTAGRPVVAAFDRHDDARSAIHALEAAGIEPRAISVVTGSRDEARRLERETGAAAGLEDDVRDHPLRDVFDWLGSIETAVVPGFGGVLWTGKLSPEIGRGGLERGAITGALVGLGLSVDEAAAREQEVFAGRTLVVVHDPRDLATARTVLGATGAPEQ
jgi:Heat induced stress protein YflT